ncbi:AAA domain-containing protein [Pelagophyceae sp. CCMP2097]|nr:AAA domain-containing protein [Pelagophyceae sp. CCMP2097]
MDLRTLGPAKGILVDSSAENAAVSALAFIGCIKIVIASDLVIARDLGPENLVRRWARLGVAVETLETQFRQHALLMAFPNEHFFHNAIQNGPQNGPQDRPPVPLDGFVWPRSALPVAFVEIAPRWTAEGRDSPKRPAHNHGDDLHEREACKVVELLSGAVEARRLNAKGAQSIGVAAATPRQLASIQALWRERRRRGGARPGDALECDDVVEFGLVDDLRGREKDLVIFSSTPAGAHASDDAQRLCVLLTRARRGLVIVGARQVLRLQAHWQQFLEWCEQRELVIDSEEWSSKLASAERGATPEMRQRLAALAQAAPHGAPVAPSTFSTFVQNALGVDAADAEALRRAVHALDGPSRTRSRGPRSVAKKGLSKSRLGTLPSSRGLFFTDMGGRRSFRSCKVRTCQQGRLSEYGAASRRRSARVRPALRAKASRNSHRERWGDTVERLRPALCSRGRKPCSEERARR